MSSSDWRIRWVTARCETAMTPTRLPCATSAAMHLAAVYVLPVPGGPCTQRYERRRASTRATAASTTSSPAQTGAIGPSAGGVPSAAACAAALGSATVGRRLANSSPKAVRVVGSATMAAATCRSARATGAPSTNSFGRTLSCCGGSWPHSMMARPVVRSRLSRVAPRLRGSSPLSLVSAVASAAAPLPGAPSTAPTMKGASSRRTTLLASQRLDCCECAHRYSYASRRLRGADLKGSRSVRCSSPSVRGSATSSAGGSAIHS